MSTTIKTAPGATQPAQPLMTVFTTASVLAMMWKKSGDEMHLHELEWIATGAAAQVGCEARALAAVLESTACLVSSDETSGAFQDSSTTSNLLFNLHNQLSTIAGLADIAADASDRVIYALKGGKA